MRIPKIFTPEKNLDEQIENLKHPKEKEIKNLTDFIIHEGLQLSEFVESDILRTYEDLPPFLNKVDLVDGIFIDYGEPTVGIIEFRDAHTLKLNINNMIEYACEFVKENHGSRIDILVKEVYACLVNTSDEEQAKEIVESYKRNFDFKEAKTVTKLYKK